MIYGLEKETREGGMNPVRCSCNGSPFDYYEFVKLQSSKEGVVVITKIKLLLLLLFKQKKKIVVVYWIPAQPMG